MHTLTLSVTELVFAKSAIDEQVERYSKSWREAFVNYGPRVGNVYLYSIRCLLDLSHEMEGLLKEAAP